MLWISNSAKQRGSRRARIKSIDDRVLYWANRSVLNIVLFSVGLALLGGISFTAAVIAVSLFAELIRL